MTPAETPVRELAPTGRLRAAINLGNPVLAQGNGAEPRGITVDLAAEFARRLSVPLELVCTNAARDSLSAVVADPSRADVCFLAIDPARAEQVTFSPPYVVIEGVFVVSTDSAIDSAEAVDAPGVRVGVKQGSAYDLHLSRALTKAVVVRGVDGTDVFDEEGLETGAGIRQPVTAYAKKRGDRRVLEPAFMQIQQAVAVPAHCSARALEWVAAVVEDCIRSGFIADALARSGQDPLLVAT